MNMTLEQCMAWARQELDSYLPRIIESWRREFRSRGAKDDEIEELIDLNVEAWPAARDAQLVQIEASIRRDGAPIQ